MDNCEVFQRGMMIKELKKFHEIKYSNKWENKIN
jgi:hypothetical protein